MADTSAPDATKVENAHNAAHAVSGLGATGMAESEYRAAEEAFIKAHRMHSAAGNDRAAANVLTCLAEIYRVQSKNCEAKRACTEAHEIHSRIGNDKGVANALIILGRTLSAESKYDEAGKAFTEAHEIHSRLGSDLGVAATLLCLGALHLGHSRFPEAKKAFMEVHKLASRIGADFGAANALRGLGHVSIQESNDGEAEKALKEAHDIYTRIGHDLDAGNTLNDLGVVFETQSKYDEAEKVFTQAHEIHARIGNGRGDAVALDRLGHIYWAQSQYEKAEKAFAEAHKIYLQLGDDQGVADALSGLGQTYGQQLRNYETEQALMEAREIYSRLGDDKGVANVLNGLGQVYGHQAKHVEAENAFMTAHQIHSRLGNDVGAANALLGLGGTYRAQSRNPEAQKALDDAHKLHPQIGDTIHSGNVYRSLGMLAQDQYRYNEAEVCYRRALTAYDSAGHADSKARTMLLLGKLQYSQHKYLDAEHSISECLSIWSSHPNAEGSAMSYFFLAQIYKSQSKHAEAKDALMQMEGLLSRIQGVILAVVLLQLGTLCAEQGMYAQAEEHFRVAEAVYSTMGNARGEARALFCLAALYEWQGQAQEAERCFAQADSLYPNDADRSGEVKAWREMIKDNSSALQILDKTEAWALQPRKSENTKGISMEACYIYPRQELEDMEGQNQDKARQILNQLSGYRLDPTSIKMTDTLPRATGGQGAVLLGTLSFSGPLGGLISIMKESERMLGITPEIRAKSGVDYQRHFDGLTKLLAEVEALGAPPHLLNGAFQEGKKLITISKILDKVSSEPPCELKVAVKVLAWNRDDVKESIKFFKSFAHEVSLMANFAHPNIVDLVGFVEDMDKGDAWIILAWEENGNVREFLQSGQWDIPERVSLIKDTASGLEYLHSRQPPICHGDLKSLNILVNSGYRAVITDFGSARIRQSIAPETEETPPSTSTEGVTDSSTPTGLTSPQIKFNPLTSDLTLTGPGFSLRWTSPEVLNGDLQDLPSDMWAMGWICWEIVTGKMPFQELNREGAIIMHTITGKLPAITKDAELSHVLGLCSLMSNCWLSEPDKRVDASTFRLEMRDIPSEIPSSDHDNSGPQKVRSAALLLELGKMHHFQSNNPAKAEVHYQAAVDIAARTKNDVVKVNALFHLGLALSLQSKYSEAEQALAEAHPTLSRLGNDLGAAHVLCTLGMLFIRRKKYCEAEKVLMEAHETFSRTGRRFAIADVPNADSDLGAADTLYHLGHLYSEQNRYREAEDAFGKAHVIYSRLVHEPGIAKASGGLGKVYCAQSRYQDAERVFMESREMYSRAGNDIEMGRTLCDLGRVYESQSRIQEAEIAFKEAHKLSSARGDNLMGGLACHFLGSLYSRVSRDLEAEEAFHQALATYDCTNDPDSRALTLVSLGELYYTQRRYLKAEEMLSEALTIWGSVEKQTEQRLPLLILSEIFDLKSKTNEDRDAFSNEITQWNDGDARRADIPARLGDYHLSQGRYGESEKCYRFAQAVSLSLKDTQKEGKALFGLGRACICQNRFDEAEACFAGSRTAFATTGNQEDEARALECLVEMYILQDKYKEARVACTEARDICDRLGRPMTNICLKTRKPPCNLEEMDAVIKLNPGAASNAQDSLRAGVLTRFGYDHLGQGAFKDAEECFRLAQSISPNLELAHERGVALLGLGVLFFTQKLTEEAEESFIQARVAFASIGDGIQEATALDALTGLYNEADRAGDAEKTCREARDIYLRMGQPMSELWSQNWKRLRGLGE